MQEGRPIVRNRINEWSRNGLRYWQLTALVLGAVAVTAMVMSLVYLPPALSEGGQGTLGYQGRAAQFGTSAAHRIEDFQPSSPLPAAGVMKGDLIVAPPRGRLSIGQHVRLRVVHGDQVRQVDVRAIAATRSVTDNVLPILETALGALALLLGGLLVLRRWHDGIALAHGASLLVAASGMFVILTPVGPLTAAVVTWYLAALPLFLILFASVGLQMAGSVDRWHRWIARCRLALLILVVCLTAAVGPYFFGRAIPAADFLLNMARPLLGAAGIVLCLFAFVRAWRRVEAEQRERLRWLFVGVVIALAVLAVMTLEALGLFGRADDALLRVTIAVDLLSGLGLATFAYAILRQRVMDVGFAISRALVYAILTGVILVGFGVTEWVVDHLLEFEGRKQSAMLDAALALGLFLVFHRLQHGISNFVERLFFRSLHLRQAALERFLELSTLFTDADALAKALLDALDAFTESTGSALHERDPQGRFVLQAATLAHAEPSIGANDMLAIQLKGAAGKPLCLDSSRKKAGSWHFPLVRRGELQGFVSVAAKRSRDVYRPDEISTVAQAVRQVGFDLYALRLEQAVGRDQPDRGGFAAGSSLPAAV